CQSSGAGQLGFCSDQSQQFVSGRERRPVQAVGPRQVEISFVDRYHLDDGSKPCQDRCYPIAPLAVFLMMSIEKNCVRTKFCCSTQWHGRLNSVFSCFVARCAHDSALIRLATDDNGYAAEFRTLQQFHGNEESVHIYVQDCSSGRGGALFQLSVLGAKTCKVLHSARLHL